MHIRFTQHSSIHPSIHALTINARQIDSLVKFEDGEHFYWKTWCRFLQFVHWCHANKQMNKNNFFSDFARDIHYAQYKH